MDAPGPSYTLLRIKRKATDAPLSSLVIQDSPESRPKRRRDVSGRPRGVFRLAETVDEAWRAQGEEGEAFQAKLGRLISPNEGDSSSPVLEAAAASRPKAQRQPRFRVVPPPPIPAGFPPRVLSEAEIDAKSTSLTFIDAQPLASSSKAASAPTAEEEKEMAAFLPMLDAYLKFDQSAPVPAPDTEERYVYDLYYRDLRTSMPLDLGAGDGIAVGALLGYASSEGSTPSSSEPEDEADEDSNDEDFYRNDYPEDEDADEDMRHFHDAFSDDDDSDNASDEDRGNWHYR